MIFVKDQLLRPKQMRLNELLSVERILAARGFQIKSEGEGSDTLIPRGYWEGCEADLIFDIFSDLSLRTELLQLIERGSYTARSKEVKQLINISDVDLTRQRFSHTFEWFVGELLRRKFMSFSSSYGVHVKDVVRNSDDETAGDYDVLSVLGDTELLYIECKTGRLSQKSIRNSIERGLALHSIATIILLGKGVNEKSLKQQIKNLNYPTLIEKPELVKVKIKGNEQSEIYKWWDCFFIPANEEAGELEPKIRTVLRLIAMRKSEALREIGIDVFNFTRLGYEAEMIDPP